MRRVALVLLGLTAAGCGEPTAARRVMKGGPPPIGPAVHSSVTIASDGVGGTTLDLVSRIASYAGEAHELRSGSECPLGLYLQAQGATTPSYMSAPGVQCPSGSATVRLAPGDTVVMTRTVWDRELSALPPGRYDVYAVVHTTVLTEVVPSGLVVTLPLAAPH